jgi:hypothetical protein
MTPDTRPLHEKLFSRASVPLHAATLAVANILGDTHPLFTKLQEVRGELNALIESKRPKEKAKK